MVDCSLASQSWILLVRYDGDSLWQQHGGTRYKTRWSSISVCQRNGVGKTNWPRLARIVGPEHKNIFGGKKTIWYCGPPGMIWTNDMIVFSPPQRQGGFWMWTMNRCNWVVFTLPSVSTCHVCALALGQHMMWIAALTFPFEYVHSVAIERLESEIPFPCPHCTCTCTL